MSIATLADIEQFETTPWEKRCNAESVYALFQNSAERYSAHTALSFQHTSAADERAEHYSYSELIAHINQAANAFHSAGVTIGAPVSFILPNLPQTHFALWGAEALGIAGPVNPLLEPAALRDIVRESASQALVVLGPTDEPGIWEKVLHIVDELPDLKALFYVPQAGAENNIEATEGGLPVLDFNKALAEQNADALNFARQVGKEDIAAYFHTGGTTGTPKLAQHTHGNQLFLASVLGDMFSYNESIVALCGLPLFHVNAVFATGLNVFSKGGQVVLLTANGFRTDGVISNLWKLVEKYQATFFSVVPTIVTAMLQCVANGLTPTPSLKYLFCGAAPISAQTLRQFTSKTGVRILEGYGMTEGTCVSSFNPEFGELRAGSIGLRLPYQQMKCVILDEEGHYLRDCEQDEQGVIVISGPNVFLGYKQAEKNAEVFYGDWLITGDLARQDNEGYFWLTGRAKDLIIRGGHNIDPKVIEDTLTQHPSIELVAALGQPDSYAGELPCAYVTFKAGKSANMAELKEFVRQNIPERAAIPVHIEALETMPVTAVGKIFKPSLRLLATRRVLESALNDIGISANVSVQTNKTHGMLAQISHCTNAEDAKQILDTFTVHYEFM
jgi:fatty-acyl-CoA synthase